VGDFTFYLGTHMPNWLAVAGVPLFVSRRRLFRRRNMPRAIARWALDSGGFTEIGKYGKWMTEPERYADEVRSWSKDIGMMDFAAIQDWMCEPAMLAKTGLTVREHQARTVQSYLDLTRLAPEVSWMPVLQGQCIPQYVDHIHEYKAAGIDLTRARIVGVGSVCRRQGTTWCKNLQTWLWLHGIMTHFFGMKRGGLVDDTWSVANWGRRVASSDSLAWSAEARRVPPMEGHTHKNCANCLEYALAWRKRVLEAVKKDADPPPVTRPRPEARHPRPN